jgi:hypothetical protein
VQRSLHIAVHAERRVCSRAVACLRAQATAHTDEQATTQFPRVHSLQAESRCTAFRNYAHLCTPDYSFAYHVATEAWFESTIRKDVNGGLNSRDLVKRRDPRLASIMAELFGDATWRSAK